MNRVFCSFAPSVVIFAVKPIEISLPPHRRVWGANDSECVRLPVHSTLFCVAFSVESRHCHVLVHGDETGAERLSHISTAMAFLFNIEIYTDAFSFLFSPPVQNLTFYSRALCTILLSNSPAKTYSRHPSTWTNTTSFRAVPTVYLDADDCHNCVCKLLQDSNKTVKAIFWCHSSLCVCVRDEELRHET